MPFLRVVLKFLVPSGLLFGGVCYLVFKSAIPPSWQPFLVFYPWLVAGAGLLLGWRFNRSRLIFVILLLSALFWAVTIQPDLSFRSFVFQSATLLVPINLAIIAFWKERGLLNIYGLLRFGWLAGQGLGVWWLYEWDAVRIQDWLSRSFVNWPVLTSIPLGQVALLFGVICGVILLLRYFWVQKPMEGGLFWGYAASLAAFCVPQQMNFWLSTTVLILLVAVIETSFSMAFNDELTGLPARRAMNEQLMKLGRRYTVAMVDVDHFKRVNDVHGHDVGDQVLRMIASCLQRVTGGGRPFRYGGEEFAVIFPGKSVGEALPHLEALRERIARSNFVVRGRKRPREKPEKSVRKKTGTKTLQVTASIGVAERNDQCSEAQQVIKAADQALYRAKKSGRNRTCA